MSGDPDVNLLETLSPDWLVGSQERVGGWVVGVDPNAEKIVAVAGAAVLPGAGDANCVLGDTAEMVAQFLGGLVKLLRVDQRAVVIGQR